VHWCRCSRRSEVRLIRRGAASSAALSLRIGLIPEFDVARRVGLGAP
jgi:hypothetical protein